MDLQNYNMISHNELVSQKSRRVKLMELLQHLVRHIKNALWRHLS